MQSQTIRRFVTLLVSALVLSACGEEPVNMGFPVAPIEDIESLAFVEFPNTVLTRDELGSEQSYMTIDSAPMCFPTTSIRSYTLNEPALFSEVQSFYNERAIADDWEIENRRTGVGATIRHPRYQGVKDVEDRTHVFRVRALQPDGTGTFEISEDQLVVGFVHTYFISPAPGHPFCG